MIKKVILCLILITCLFAPSFASSEQGPGKDEGMGAQCHDLGIEVRGGLVSMDVENAEIPHVLEEIARKAKIDLYIDEGVRGKISIKMNDETVENALKRLCENRAIVFEYLPSRNSYKIISAGAYSGKKGREPGEYDAPRDSKTGPGQSARPPLPRIQAEKNRGLKHGYHSQVRAGRESKERMYDRKGRLLYKPGELLVKFKEGATKEQIADLHKSLGSKVIGRIDRVRLQRIKLREGLSEQEAIELYSASGIVELVERHALRYPNGTVPNDPYFANQWGLTKIHVPEAWGITQGSPEIIIAVIDTGADYLHPDLSDNTWINTAELSGIQGNDDDENGYVDDICGWDFAGDDKHNLDDQDADPMDVDGHGTHVSGIIAAKGNNGQGVAGVCWNAKIMVLKVQADNGERMEDWDVISAIDYAIDNGARIVNCSFGGETYGQTEYDAFLDLHDAGILAVCATGNDGVSIDIGTNINYPASYGLDNIFSVAASDQGDNLASFSNYGPISVDAMAPGFHIYSTDLGPGYDFKQGTSMAAPHVTGIAGLLLSVNPALDYAGLKSAILNTVDKIESVSDKMVSGGRVNALCALCSIDTIPGDLSCDDKVELDDAILALQVLSGVNPHICPACISCGIDVNGDHRIGLEEVIYVMQKVGGIER